MIVSATMLLLMREMTRERRLPSTGTADLVLAGEVSRSAVLIEPQGSRLQLRDGAASTGLPVGQQLLQLQQELSSAGRKTGRDRVAPVAHLSAKAAEVRQSTVTNDMVRRQERWEADCHVPATAPATREAPKTFMMGLGAPESDDETSNNPNHCSSRLFTKTPHSVSCDLASLALGCEEVRR